MFEFKMDTLHPGKFEDLIECSDYTALSHCTTQNLSFGKRIIFSVLPGAGWSLLPSNLRRMKRDNQVTQTVC